MKLECLFERRQFCIIEIITSALCVDHVLRSMLISVLLHASTVSLLPLFVAMVRLPAQTPCHFVASFVVPACRHRARNATTWQQRSAARLLQLLRV